MGILRNISKTVSGFFFSSFLTLLIFVLAISSFTAYDNLKPVVTDVIKQQITTTPEELNKTYEALSFYCKTSGNETIFVPLQSNYTQFLELKCSDVLKITFAQVPELIANTTFDNLYFKKYNCSFIRCIQLPGEEKFLFIMSEQANKFLQKTIVYFGVLTVLSALALFVTTETWAGKFKAVGLILFFLGISYFLIPLIENFLMPKLPQEYLSRVTPVITKVFDSISYYVLFIFIIGVILTAIGIVLGHLGKKEKIEKK